ncbi:MAG: bifunctional hydroxymethylpyrimidine kinase/phosphomethylpyrimidine kinase [Gammaproteobacteria bacterium]|nr:bifunctional hydroxymethylpyrimidine kinase/phosphomethylpyrimidine kinase [Gammaproteobacteria bacterium]
MSAVTRTPVVLAIAGSDSGGGAGIQADLKAIAACGAYGAAAVTALTAQNTLGVQGVFIVPAQFVAQQIDSVMQDIGADVWKIGMLGSVDVIECVAERALHYNVERLVLDPVMVAKGGDRLLPDDAGEALRRSLLPLALLVTPNHHEAGVLAERPIHNVDDMHVAAAAIQACGARNVLVKGGDLPGAGEQSIDVLFDGHGYRVFSAPRIASKNTHGTGCTLASAIAAELAAGRSVEEAIGNAKAYVGRAIAGGMHLGIGSGHGPLQHFPDA